MPQSDRFDVCVKGSGAVGTSLALALARQGLRVAITAPPLAPNTEDARAFALNAASRALLTELKVWQALPAEALTPVYDMQVAGDGDAAARQGQGPGVAASAGHGGARAGAGHGGAPAGAGHGGAPAGALAFSAWQQAVEALAWIVDAQALDMALDTALRFAPHLQRVAEPVDAALTVWADGKASAAHGAPGVQLDSQDYGQTALAARLVCDRPHGHTAWQWFRSPDVLALLPLNQPAAGAAAGQGFALVWSLPTAQAQALMQLDAAGFEARLNQAVCGALTAQVMADVTADVTADAWADVTAVVTPDAALLGPGHPTIGGLRLASARATWPLRLARAQPLCGPGWVLVGDAAHVVHPLAGQGLNLGLADVASLAAVIAAREPWRELGDERLLHRHARARALPTLAMAGLTDGLLHLFARPQPLVRELRNRGMTLLNHLAPIKRMLAARALDA